MWSIEAYWTGMVPEAKMIRVILRLFIILRVIWRIFCCFDLSHVLYSSKVPCCSLACGHRRISGRRFSSPKWVEKSNDRKYVCVRRLAVPKRHNFCSRTLVSWPLPAPVTISSGWLTPFKVRRGLPHTSKNPGTFPTGSPSSKYEHRRASAMLRNIQNTMYAKKNLSFL